MFREFANDRYKKIFLWTVIFGLMSHILIITNIIRNHDSARIKGYGAGITSGRWFLTVLGEFIEKIKWGNYNLAGPNAFLAILFIAASVCLIVEMMNIQSDLLAALLGWLMVAFPAVVDMMFFSFTIGYDMFATFLTVLAVYISVRYKNIFSYLLATLFASMGLGIYQAYFPMMYTLYLIILIRNLLYPDKYDGEIKTVIRDGVRYLLLSLASLIAYFIEVQITLKVYHTSLSNYRDIDKWGGMRLGEIPAALFKTYIDFFRAPARNLYCVAVRPVIKYVWFILLALTALILICRFVRIRKDKIRLILSVIFVAAFPLVSDSIVFMCYHTTIETLMVYSLAAIFILPVVLTDNLFSEKGENYRQRKENRFYKGLKSILIVSLSIMCTCYTWLANGNYTTLWFSNQQAYFQFESVITQAKSLPGFHKSLRWAFIGAQQPDGFYENPWLSSADAAPFYYSNNTNYMVASYSRYELVAEVLGYKLNTLSGEEVNELKKDERIKEMPVYPEDGGIQIVDDKVVVKYLEIADE